MWIRDVVHVVRKDGEVEALVGFMFDISERKKTEEHLLRLQEQLEEYSFQDGLTGIANRRMCDTVLEREWSSAQRSQLPLSLIILDIDYFKQYSDHYGHIQGDDCLRRVAQTLALATNRPRDFVARMAARSLSGCCRKPTPWRRSGWPINGAPATDSPRRLERQRPAEPAPWRRHHPRRPRHLGPGLRRTGRPPAVLGQEPGTHGLSVRAWLRSGT